MVRVSKPRVIICSMDGCMVDPRLFPQTLMPYARSHIGLMLRDWYNDEDTQAALSTFRNSVVELARTDPAAIQIPSSDAGAGQKEVRQAVEAEFEREMKGERYSSAAKGLILMVVLYGLRKGQIRGHAYPDVRPALLSWTQSGIKVVVLSSGSKLMSQAIMATTPSGDLTPMVTEWFDYIIGDKLSEKPYRRIARDQSVDPADVLFLTCDPNEAKAARRAGCTFLLTHRPHVHVYSAEAFQGTEGKTVTSFADITFAQPSGQGQGYGREPPRYDEGRGGERGGGRGPYY